MFEEVLGGTIRRLREQKGMSQEQAADRGKVNHGTWNGWETGKHWPRPNMFENLLEGIDCTADELSRAFTLDLSKTFFPNANVGDLLSRPGLLQHRGITERLDAIARLEPELIPRYRPTLRRLRKQARADYESLHSRIDEYEELYRRLVAALDGGGVAVEKDLSG